MKSYKLIIVLTLIAVFGVLIKPAMADIVPYYAYYPSEYINKKGNTVFKFQISNKDSAKGSLAEYKKQQELFDSDIVPVEFDKTKILEDGTIIKYKPGYWGYIDKYVLHEYAPGKQFIVKDVNKKGQVTNSRFDKPGEYKPNKILIKPQFDYAYSFFAGVAPVRKGDKWGYIDKTGKFIIKPQFTMVGSYNCSPGKFAPWAYTHKCKNPGYFCEGLAAVAIDNGKFGFIDKTGKYIIKPQYDAASPFSEGMAAVNIGAKQGYGGKWGYIDRTGKMIIKPKYDYAGQFKNGIAEVKRSSLISPLFVIFGSCPILWVFVVIIIWAGIATRKQKRENK